MPFGTAAKGLSIGSCDLDCQRGHGAKLVGSDAARNPRKKLIYRTRQRRRCREPMIMASRQMPRRTFTDGSGAELTVKLPFDDAPVTSRKPPLSSIKSKPELLLGTDASVIGPIGLPSTYAAKAELKISRMSPLSAPKPTQGSPPPPGQLGSKKREGLLVLKVSESPATMTVDENGAVGVLEFAKAVIVSKLLLNGVPSRVPEAVAEIV
jgi:hypothetical protein